MTIFEEKSALVIIDMQIGFLENRKAYAGSEVLKVSNKITQLGEQANEKNIPIIYIQHGFEGFLGRLFCRVFMKGAGLQGTPSCEISKDVFFPKSVTFTKSTKDAFSNPKLNEYLKSLKINNLFIVGLDGNYCIRSTILGAIKNGYKASIVDEGVLAQDDVLWQKNLKALNNRGTVILK